MPIEGGPGLPGEYRPTDWPDAPLPAWIDWDGYSARLRPGATPVLLRALARRNWTAFVPGLLRARDVRWLDARLADRNDPLDLLEVAVAAQWVAAHVCRMPWWAAARLAGQARQEWATLEGTATLGGASLLDMPVDRVLAAQWALLRRNAEADKDRLAELQAAVFEPDREALELGALAAPLALAAIEAELAQEAAASFAGMDGFMSM